MSYETKVQSFKDLCTQITETLPLIEGRTFTDESVSVDFGRYNNCTFVKCTILVEFGLFSFSKCDFVKCVFEAKQDSPARTVLVFDKMISESVPAKIVKLASPEEMETKTKYHEPKEKKLASYMEKRSKEHTITGI
jgi:hypothetical protein